MTDLDQAIEDGIAPWTELVDEDFHVAIYRDRYPVTRGHLLFVPKYNTLGVIGDALRDALETGERMVADGECEGYNVGINQGRTAGQTVMYPHVHLSQDLKVTAKTPLVVCGMLFLAKGIIEQPLILSKYKISGLYGIHPALQILQAYAKT